MTGVYNDCVCELIELFGGTKTEIVSLITTTIALLQALEIQIKLYSNFNGLVDEAKKAGLQVSLGIIEASVATIEAPFNALLSRSKLLSDCDPVNTFSAIIKNTEDKILQPVEDMRYDVEQLIAAIEDQKSEVETIERWIKSLEKLRDALELCGES